MSGLVIRKHSIAKTLRLMDVPATVRDPISNEDPSLVFDPNAVSEASRQGAAK